MFSETAKPWLRRVVELQYRAALLCAHFTFFQNEEDQSLFTGRGLVKAEKTGVVPGSGVDIEQFAPIPGGNEHKCESRVVFLMVSRLLRDKGVYEFIEAANRVKKEYPQAIFQLLGKRDQHNPTVVPLEDLRKWKEAGVVDYLGEVSDVRGERFFSNADVIGVALLLPRRHAEVTAGGGSNGKTNNNNR